MEDLTGALAALVRDRSEAALFLDYDGTLAPIVDDPVAARPLPGVREVLGRLADRFGLVAIVSGRPVAFLHEVLGQPPGLHVVGLYGLESAAPGGAVLAAPAAETWRRVVTEVARRAEEEAPVGTDVEPKGLTVTVHWRRAPTTEPWARAFVDRETARTGLAVQPGRMALELRPPIAADKGDVVRELGQGRPAAACFGDDLADLPAFRALGELAAQGAVVVRVAVVDAESPPEVAAAADLSVSGPDGALALLGRLADAG